MVAWLADEWLAGVPGRRAVHEQALETRYPP